MNKRGRKAKYETKVKPYFDKIIMWRRDGHTEAQIAQLLGIGVSTFEKYKSEHDEFKEVLDSAKDDLVASLEKTLFQKARGMEYEEVKTVIEKDDSGKDKKKIEKTKKWLPPDTTALIFSLKNLKPEAWRDKHDVNHTGSVINANVDLSYMTEEELEKALKKYGDG